MQPEPPRPPQQPGFSGQPPQGQPYPYQPQPGQPYQQGQQYPGQPGMAPQFQGAPPPKKKRTGLIVLIAALVVFVGGGGAIALVLINGNKPAAPQGPAGRYTTDISCSQIVIDDKTYNYYENLSGPQMIGGSSDVECGTGGLQNNPTINVNMYRYPGPGGIAAAKQYNTERDSGTQLVSGTGFENPPSVQYQMASGSTDCSIGYLRSNLYVDIDLIRFPGIHDTASCQTIGMPYVKKIYNAIG